ncbi:hypothetical protein D8674_021304 [Pyrus ussuriensis x Pyrus communis]|uniref:Uncharacterized protein n=1 Tax=Pyrus ussuriensis x Pyrus communis TaxID=2448454 RepID=A0A5N5GGS6_9ROSA|nr:hypothetical protein D8674_021304 [Pyrus ussuriensis x Pyrus communis]
MNNTILYKVNQEPQFSENEGSGAIRLSIGAVPTWGFSWGLGAGAQEPSSIFPRLSSSPARHGSQELDQFIEYLDLDLSPPGREPSISAVLGLGTWDFQFFRIRHDEFEG